MSEQKSTPDPELLNQIAKEYEINKKFLGTAEGMSELEAEVEKNIPALVLLRHGFDLKTIFGKLGGYFPVADAFVRYGCKPTSANADGFTIWDKKNFYEICRDIHLIVADLERAAKACFIPNHEEFVLLVSVDQMEYLSKGTPQTGTVRQWIARTYPRCSVMVIPDNAEVSIICVIAKVAGMYLCVSRYGI